MEATGLPLGLFAEADFEELSFDPRPGDLFVLFSDGILDARNRDGELFGRERLEKVVSKVASGTAQEVVDAIFSAMGEHAAGVEAFDDATVVALKVRGKTAKTK